jgi:hypothetical protein
MHRSTTFTSVSHPISLDQKISNILKKGLQYPKENPFSESRKALKSRAFFYSSQVASLVEIRKTLKYTFPKLT